MARRMPPAAAPTKPNTCGGAPKEERRHRVRVVVHPVQLTEWELLVERAEWEITTETSADVDSSWPSAG